MESELVSGFMTEHAAVIFVFYLYDILPLSMFSLVQYTNFDYYIEETLYHEHLGHDPLIEGLYYGLSLGLKSCIMIFIFI
jgi:hypothetical protein